MRTALAFSGGMDSWACLYLYKDKLDDIDVIWVNANKNYPELELLIEKAKKMCPNFIEISIDRDLQTDKYGLPSDLVNVDNTEIGFIVNGEKSVKVQNRFDCCYNNISYPLLFKIKELGITHLIRGQRIEEEHKSPARDGDIVDGIEYLQPIENWTRKQVLSYLSEHMDIPEHFKLNHTSLDCHDCTAYVEHSLDRYEWAREHHPELHKNNMLKLNNVMGTIIPIYKLISGACNG
ncbi:MAG: phosphoadenosine phosphosulfate reductase family protein [Methylophilus sp.]|jgi:phosphoadenosine phosphosulfate reductase